MAKDKPIATVVDYRTCFNTEAGKRVLANMMAEGGFFEVNKTSEKQAVENFIKIVLSKCGCYPEIEFEQDEDGFICVNKTSMDIINKFVANMFDMSVKY